MLRTILVASSLALSAAQAGYMTGAFCRVSTATLSTHDKNYLPFEKPLYTATDLTTCNAKCKATYDGADEKVACAHWNGAVCYCTLSALNDGDPTETMCMSPMIGVESYVNLASAPADCGNDLPYCNTKDCASIGDDCCASWDITLETRSCKNGGTPVPAGRSCFFGQGEDFHCCSTEPEYAEDAPCFPSHSLVTMADGKMARVGALKEGDAIVAVTMDGTLTTDSVTLLSISEPEASATFDVLTTAANTTLTLTPAHHVAVGTSCCATFKQAKDVNVGETVHIVTEGAITTTTVVAKSSTHDTGLHSPVLLHGGHPVVDGHVTAFDRIESVTLARYGLVPLIKGCKATGTCSSMREMFLGADAKYLK